MWLQFVTYIFFLFVKVLTVFIDSSDLVRIFMAITLNSFSGKLFISNLLRFFLGIYFIWSVVLCFFIFIDFLFWFLCIRWNNHVSVSWNSGLMKEIHLVVQPCPRSWLPLKSLWLSKQPFMFLIVPSIWSCVKTCQSRGEHLSQNLILGWLKARLSGSSS